MKKTMTALWVLLAPTLVLAQTAAKPAAPATPAAPKAAAAKPAASAAKAAPKAKAKPAPKPSKVEIKSTASNMAAGIEAADAALTPAELAIAQRVHTGLIPCELGAQVLVEADPKAPGYFNLTTKNIKYRMFPIPTSTGAIRLEDQRAGAVWMQLGNKSMLLNQKLGQRQADECVSPQQALVIEQMKGKPAQNVLEPLPAAPAAVAPAPGVAASGAVAVPATVPGVVYPTGPTPPARKTSAAK
ncbi:MAG: hypothetical protein V4562_05635 [Pseudomonadota bacterium]